MMNSSNFSNEQRENAGGTGTSRYKLMQYLPFFVLFVAILLLFLMFLQRKSNAVGKEEAFSSDYSRAYGSYLAHLEEKGEAISSYVWQYGGQDVENAGEEAEHKEGKTVLLWDIFGDDTPELLYIEGNSGREDGRVSQADLQVYSFVGGKLEHLCTMDSLDVFAGGGVNYTLFQIQGEKTLYLYREEYDGQMLERLYRLNNGSLPLSFEEIASHSYEAFGGEDVSEDVGENVGESVGETAGEGSVDTKKESPEENKEESSKGSSGQFTLHGKEVKEQEYLKLWEGLKKRKSHILLSNGPNSKFEDAQGTADLTQKTEDKAQNTLDGAQKPEKQPEKSTDSSENTAKEYKNSNQLKTASVKNIALSYNEALFFLQGQILKEGDDSDILLESLPDSLLLSILEKLEQGSPSTGEIKNMEILSVKKEKTAYRILLKFISESFPEEQYRSCLVAENAGEQGLTFTVQNMAEASAEEKSKMESMAQALQEEVAEQAGEGLDANGGGQNTAVEDTESVSAEENTNPDVPPARDVTWQEWLFEFELWDSYKNEVPREENPSLALYDITNDGIPELLVGSNSGSTYSDIYFYQVTGQGVKKIEGVMSVYSSTAYAGYSKNRKYPGLFGGLWYRGDSYDFENGINRMYYYYYEGGQIKSTEIATYSMYEENRVDTPVTKDTALFSAYKNRDYIQFYTSGEVFEMGWDNFLKAYHY